MTDNKVIAVVEKLQEVLKKDEFESFESDFQKAEEDGDKIEVLTKTVDKVLEKNKDGALKLDKDTKALLGSVTKKVDYSSNALKVISELGLILFVASVGFIAGPTFFSNLKKNFKSYILLGAIIILSGGLASLLCFYLGKVTGGIGSYTSEEFISMIVGLMAGALTSTPAFSAATDTAGTVGEGLSDIVSAGYGISYLFGVVGVVLFVQLMPKLLKADMNKERALIVGADTGTKKQETERKLIEMDDFGIMPLALAALIGILIGKIDFGGFFSLGNTGGVLIACLIFGHFGRIGKFSLMPKVQTLKVFREFGLALFLIGAGVPGGMNFVANVKPIFFVYGMIITIIPMFLGYLFARYVLKLPLLNNLGSITGGMTSTPALGTLINVSGTESVASAYAATYPIALILVVLVAKFLFAIA
ncbi:MAG: permease [Ruminococcaceae bacterium]|nr:permease [Oscillospiraceae bacterium]